MNSLEEIAKFLREKADEIDGPYTLEAVKLLKAADILFPLEQPS